jgi:threonine dehydratase
MRGTERYGEYPRLRRGSSISTIRAEGAAAAPLAARDGYVDWVPGSPVTVIVSGGNIDLCLHNDSLRREESPHG